MKRLLAALALAWVALACTLSGDRPDDVGREGPDSGGALEGAVAGIPLIHPIHPIHLIHPGAADRLGSEFTEEELRKILRHSPLGPPPPDPTNAVADDPRAARLGQWLFFDERLSGTGRHSCASCHDPELGFSDGRELAKGFAEVKRHSASVWNVAYQRWFFWDGRRDALWNQALVPLEHPLEMAGNRVAIARYLASRADLSAAYEEVFGPLPDVSALPDWGRPIPDDEEHFHAEPKIREHEHDDHPHQIAWNGLTDGEREAVNRVFVNVGKALAAYQRRLVSRRSPFDVFVEGLRDGDEAKLDALDASARRGLRLFVGEANCTLCHSGPEFTDREFHDVLVPPLRADLADDPGRFGALAEVREHPFRATGPYSDAPDDPGARKIDFLTDPSGHPDHGSWGSFKTPTLRNVVLSPPYMHHGQLPDLAAVLDHYSTLDPSRKERGHVETFLRPLELSPGEREDLMAFLESLVDTDVPAGLLRRPDSP